MDAIMPPQDPVEGGRERREGQAGEGGGWGEAEGESEGEGEGEGERKGDGEGEGCVHSANAQHGRHEGGKREPADNVVAV